MLPPESVNAGELEAEAVSPGLRLGLCQHGNRLVKTIEDRKALGKRQPSAQARLAGCRFRCGRIENLHRLLVAA